MTKEERDRDFRRCCVRVMRSCPAAGAAPGIREVTLRAMTMAPDCFHIDADYAYRKVRMLLRRGPAPVLARASEAMWLELAAMVAAEMIVNGRRSVMAALDTVLRTRRPSSFHISVDSARRMAARPRRSRHVPPVSVSEPCV